VVVLESEDEAIVRVSVEPGWRECVVFAGDCCLTQVKQIPIKFVVHRVADRVLAHQSGLALGADQVVFSDHPYILVPEAEISDRGLIDCLEIKCARVGVVNDLFDELGLYGFIKLLLTLKRGDDHLLGDLEGFKTVHMRAALVSVRKHRVTSVEVL
jgi:hypothetical protein